ncbi:MAG: GH3 auxin-responsive promoter family protein [Dehalococcoidaceae bacterium]|nr:GH3 auxin-responsive promoter family protein [Dehalococcoidaceae bacterium]
MSRNVELFKKGEHQEMWQRCCGFIDLSIEEFMLIQKRLLLEQLEMVKKCELGQKILGGTNPETLEEFRRTVPLTTYADYAPHLLKRRMEGLPRKPILWQCTSGKSGESTFRWVPVTSRQLDEIEPLIFALIFFSSCQNRGEIKFKEGDKVFYGMAPPPYATGTMTRVLPHEIFEFLPPVEMSEQVSFEERTKVGFKMALEDGLDLCFAMSSVAVAIGNRFSGGGSSSTLNRKYLMAHPGMAVRLLRGMIKSKMEKRKMLPRDVWNLKGMITFGLDGEVYREKIKEMWGRYPLDFHGCTEAVVIATQTWDYEGMTFVPNLNFFEFITEQDSIRSSQDPDFVPPTYLLSEIKPGNYELVITSFHGGPFIRYRLGHLIKIHSIRNEKLDIDIPQMSFIGRIDDQIDIAGFTRLSEKVIWQAVEKTGIEYVGWTARKEIEEKPVLNIYLELKGGTGLSAQQAAMLIHKQLKKLDVPYSELETFTGLNPLTVTLLPRGAFAAYKQHQVAQGADITRLKPPHLNPTDDMIAVLIQPAEVPVVTGEAVKV